MKLIYNGLIFDSNGNVNLDNYYTKSEVDNKLNSYALKSQIPSTSNLATKTELDSVKTIAQNALNTANSKLTFANAKAYVQFSNGGTITASHNALINVCVSGTGPYYIDGFKILINSFYINSEREIYIYSGTLKKGSKLSTDWRHDSSRVGVYLY